MEDDLKHEYASPYYDPQKAHEYYLKNRDLKGKRKASDLKSDKQKETWTVAKSNIASAKRQESKKNVESRKAELEKLRSSSKLKSNQIKEKIQNAINAIRMQQADSRNRALSLRQNRLEIVARNKEMLIDRAQKEAQKKVDALPPLGDPPSKAEITQRNRALAAINKEFKGKISEANKAASLYKKAVSESIPIPKKDVSQTKQLSASKKEQLAKVSGELKSGLASSKKKYDELRKNLASKYETIYQNEFDRIQKEA